jgi:hypothetical protein
MAAVNATLTTTTLHTLLERAVASAARVDASKLFIERIGRGGVDGAGGGRAQGAASWRPQGGVWGATVQKHEKMRVVCVVAQDDKSKTCGIPCRSGSTPKENAGRKCVCVKGGCEARGECAGVIYDSLAAGEMNRELAAVGLPQMLNGTFKKWIERNPLCLYHSEGVSLTYRTLESIDPALGFSYFDRNNSRISNEEEDAAKDSSSSHNSRNQEELPRCDTAAASPSSSPTSACWMHGEVYTCTHVPNAALQTRKDMAAPHHRCLPGAFSWGFCPDGKYLCECKSDRHAKELAEQHSTQNATKNTARPQLPRPPLLSMEAVLQERIVALETRLAERGTPDSNFLQNDHYGSWANKCPAEAAEADEQRKIKEAQELWGSPVTITVVTLRHPVDRAISLYWYEHVGYWDGLRKNTKRVATLAQWLKTWEDNSVLKQKIASTEPSNTFLEPYNYFVKSLGGWTGPGPASRMHLDAAKRSLEKFDVVILTERLKVQQTPRISQDARAVRDHLAPLHALLGADLITDPVPTSYSLEANVEPKKRLGPTLLTNGSDAEAREKLTRGNALDLELWEFVQDLVKRRSAAAAAGLLNPLISAPDEGIGREGHGDSSLNPKCGALVNASTYLSAAANLGRLENFFEIHWSPGHKN